MRRCSAGTGANRIKKIPTESLLAGFDVRILINSFRVSSKAGHLKGAYDYRGRCEGIIKTWQGSCFRLGRDEGNATVLDVKPLQCFKIGVIVIGTEVYQGRYKVS